MSYIYRTYLLHNVEIVECGQVLWPLPSIRVPQVRACSPVSPQPLGQGLELLLPARDLALERVPTGMRAAR